MFIWKELPDQSR